jgi:hypothetical protein
MQKTTNFRFIVRCFPQKRLYEAAFDTKKQSSLASIGCGSVVD